MKWTKEGRVHMAFFPVGAETIVVCVGDYSKKGDKFTLWAFCGQCSVHFPNFFPTLEEAKAEGEKLAVDPYYHKLLKVIR